MIYGIKGFYFLLLHSLRNIIYGIWIRVVGGFLKMKSNDTGVPYLIVGIVEIFLGILLMFLLWKTKFAY